MCSNQKDTIDPYYTSANYSAYHTNGDGLISYAEAEKLSNQLPELNLYMHDSGMMCTHNIPCTVCKTNHAVFNLADGVAEPCRECRRLGWSLTFTKPVPPQKTPLDLLVEVSHKPYVLPILWVGVFGLAMVLVKGGWELYKALAPYL